MLEEVNRLTSLVENLLTLTRADSGTIELKRAPVSAVEIVREAARLFDVLLEEKTLQLVLDVDEDAWVEGDGLFLRQALANIIHNAIKYSPVGEAIRVRVQVSQDNSIVIEIVDHGPGIPTEHREKIFERFYRVDKSRNRQSGGTGLGLSIARWAVEAHGGSIGVNPNGQGCTFRISLPRLCLTESTSSKVHI
jgi:signal transduction histidine kinase